MPQTFRNTSPKSHIFVEFGEVSGRVNLVTSLNIRVKVIFGWGFVGVIKMPLPTDGWRVANFCVENLRVGLQVEFFFDFIHIVELFPCEEFHFEVEFFALVL